MSEKGQLHSHDKVNLGLGAIGAIVATYAIYMFYNPGSDGVVYASVVGSITAIVAGIAGYMRGKG